MGLYVGEQAYLRSSWNILDGFLVFVSLIDIVVSMAGGAKILGVLRVLRLLRTLRPLRLAPSNAFFFFLLSLCFYCIFFPDLLKVRHDHHHVSCQSLLSIQFLQTCENVVL